MFPDFKYGITPGDYIYDIETYPNAFTIGIIHTVTEQRWYFECSARQNTLHHFREFMNILSANNCRMVGYNNLGFDYPVIHDIYNNAFITVEEIYTKAMSIIKGQNRFGHMIWESDRVVEQLDLFKIHHFDNKARSTSLKVLEFNMRMDNIEDLPFPVGVDLTHEQIETLVDYMWHDIKATLLFYRESINHIKFREELTTKYNRDFMNHNDTKIGKDYFIMQLEQSGVQCYGRDAKNRRAPIQTLRPQIALSDAILPYIQFEHPEFQRILTWMKSQTITETKGVFKGVNCTVDGFRYDFGTGGIHGSVESQIVYSDDEYMIDDRDVASYYPNLAIANNLYPEHLGQRFAEIYVDVYKQRQQYKKGTIENGMLKLALNGVYGDSNNQYSPFYDPQYTMSITINGQLLLCVLAEQLLKTPNLTVVQINTDGVTVRYPRVYKDHVNAVCDWWEKLTNLQLESVEYNRMIIRDVNSYIAETIDGKLKRKGAYEYELEWHKDHSCLVVAKAAEAALVRGEDIAEFIYNHQDVFDFMLRAKVPRGCRLEWGGDVLSNIVRYYVSTDGDILEKVMPPKGTPGEYKRAAKLTDAYFEAVMDEIGPGVWDERIHTKSKTKYDDEVRTGICTGWTVQPCNDMTGHTFSDINYDYYIKEAEKLVLPLLK